MARPKSFLMSVSVDEARSSHNCQNNSAHRIHKGDLRLKVRKGRSVEHYCIQCGQRFLRRDLQTLQDMLEELACANPPADGAGEDAGN